MQFFAATFRNENTREAYLRAVLRFLRWADASSLDLTTIRPIHVASYIEMFGKARQEDGSPFSPPTIKRHLAAIKMVFDYLVTGQVVPTNPVSSVRGPKYVIRKGKTPVLSAEEARILLENIDVSTVVGLRDRALIGTMLYSFARVSAVVGMTVQDYYPQGKRSWIRLHEKGGKFHEVPCHHKAEEYLDAYLDAAGIRDQPKFPLFRSTRGRTSQLTEKGLTRVDAFRIVQRRAKTAGLVGHMPDWWGIFVITASGPRASPSIWKMAVRWKLRLTSRLMSRRGLRNCMIARQTISRWKKLREFSSNSQVFSFTVALVSCFAGSRTKVTHPVESARGSIWISRRGDKMGKCLFLRS